MGLAQVFCMVSCNTAIQENVDEAYRGRASSLFSMSFFAAAPIGALVGGIVGDLLNLRVTVVAAAVILALVHHRRDDPLRPAAGARRAGDSCSIATASRTITSGRRPPTSTPRGTSSWSRSTRPARQCLTVGVLGGTGFD